VCIFLHRISVLRSIPCNNIRPGRDGDAPLPQRGGGDLEIEVLAAQNIPLHDQDGDPRRFEPYVKIEVHVDNPSSTLKVARR